MGGALAATSSSHGRPRSVSKVHYPPTTTSKFGSERPRASKRQFEDSNVTGREGDEGVCDPSGLSTSQRVAAFLSSSDGSSERLLNVGVKEPPMKKEKAYQPHPGDNEQHVKIVDLTAGQSLSEKTPIPSEGYIPVQQLPPLKVRNRF